MQARPRRASVQRPMIRKLSGLTGAELWAEGTIVLDDREGWAVDVAVAPDGDLGEQCPL